MHGTSGPPSTGRSCPLLAVVQVEQQEHFTGRDSQPADHLRTLIPHRDAPSLWLAGRKVGQAQHVVIDPANLFVSPPESLIVRARTVQLTLPIEEMPERVVSSPVSLLM